ncbi:hypothetical protein BpHYR1_018493, partial [Brachionus plicatilis]
NDELIYGMETTIVFVHNSESINDEVNANADDYTPLILDSESKNEKRSFSYLIYTLDIILSLFLFGPLVSFYWNSSWEFLDLFFFVNEPELSNFICWILGLLIIFPTYLFQKSFEGLNTSFERSAKFKSKIFQIIIRTCYIYTLGLGVLLQWRGLWNLIDIFFFKDWKRQMILSIICIGFLSLTRATKILLSNPFILYRDDYGQFYTGASRHKFEIPDCHQFSFDFVLSELVECLALTGAWKGIDNFYYEFLFPNDELHSLIASFAISHFLFLVMLLLQHMIFKQCSTKSLFPRLIIENVLNIIMFFIAVLYWKFYWDIMEDYMVNIFEPDALFEILIATHFLSFFIGFVLKASGLLIGPAARLLDGEYEENSDSYIDIDYLKSIFKKNRTDEGVSKIMVIQHTED